jgi:hypothetical protein
MLTREPHPPTLRKNRPVWHCPPRLDHRRACLFDPLVPVSGVSDITYMPATCSSCHDSASALGRDFEPKEGRGVSGRTRSRKEHKLVFLRPGRREDLHSLVGIADGALITRERKGRIASGKREPQPGPGLGGAMTHLLTRCGGIVSQQMSGSSLHSVRGQLPATVRRNLAFNLKPSPLKNLLCG